MRNEEWDRQVAAGERFRFGRNWRRFLEDINSDRIQAAEESLKDIVGVPRLDDLEFLDAGCGSGLSSLAARNLGARVIGFDVDPESVTAAERLKSRTRPDDDGWRIELGSVLDPGFVAGLGKFDVVYSWGVLHHTGDMWSALRNILPIVRDGGTLALALYNDQGDASQAALRMKRRYVRSGPISRRAILAMYTATRGVRALGRDLLNRRNPLRRLRSDRRGMSPMIDLLDWVGGYPFEVARPEQVLDAVRLAGFELVWLRTVGGGSGNNEFRFVRKTGLNSTKAAAGANDPA